MSEDIIHMLAKQGLTASLEQELNKYKWLNYVTNRVNRTEVSEHDLMQYIVLYSWLFLDLALMN